MLSILLFPTLSLLSAAFASLTPVDLSGLQDIVSGNGFIKYPVQAIQNTTGNSHRKRQDSLTLTNSFTGTFYVVSCMTVPIQLDSKLGADRASKYRKQRSTSCRPSWYWLQWTLGWSGLLHSLYNFPPNLLQWTANVQPRNIGNIQKPWTPILHQIR